MTKFAASIFCIAVLLSTIVVYPMQVADATYQIPEEQFPTQKRSMKDIFLCQSGVAVPFLYVNLLHTIFEIGSIFKGDALHKLEDLTTLGKVIKTGIEGMNAGIGAAEIPQYLIKADALGAPAGWWGAIGSILALFGVLFILSIVALFFSGFSTLTEIDFAWGVTTHLALLAAEIGLPACGALLSTEKPKTAGEKVGSFFMGFFDPAGESIKKLDPSIQQINLPEWKAVGQKEFPTQFTINTKSRYAGDYKCGSFIIYPATWANRGPLTVHTFGTLSPEIPYTPGYISGVPEIFHFLETFWVFPQEPLRDILWDTDLNHSNKPGITKIGTVDIAGWAINQNLSADTINQFAQSWANNKENVGSENPSISKIPNDLKLNVNDLDVSDKARLYKVILDTITKTSTPFDQNRILQYDIFLLGEGDHSINFAAGHASATTGHSKTLLPLTLKIEEDNPPTVAGPPRIMLEKTFPDGAIIPPSFERELIESSKPLDDCTSDEWYQNNPDKWEIKTDLYEHLNSNGRLPDGLNLINMTTNDRWDNPGWGLVEVLVIDTIPPDIHPVDTVGVETLTANDNTILGSNFMNPDYIPGTPNPPILQTPYTFDLGSFNPNATCVINNERCENYEFPKGTTKVTWIVNDTVGNINQIPQEVKVREKGTNKAPSGIGHTFNVAKGMPTELVIQAQDDDHDRLKFSIVDSPLLGGLQVHDEAIFQNRFISEGNINDFGSFEIVVKKGVNELSDFVTFVGQPSMDRVIVYNDRVGLVDIIQDTEFGADSKGNPTFIVNEVITTPKKGFYDNAVDFWVIDWNQKLIKNVFYCHDHGFPLTWPCDKEQIQEVQTIQLPYELGVSDPHSMTSDGSSFYFIGEKDSKLVIVKVSPGHIGSLQIINTGLDYSKNTYLAFCGVECGSNSLLLADWAKHERSITKLSIINGRPIEKWDLKGEFVSELQKTLHLSGQEAKLIDPGGIKVDHNAKDLTIYVGDSRRSNIILVQLDDDKGKTVSDDNFGMDFVDINAIETDYDDRILLAHDRGLTKFAYGGTLLLESTENGIPTSLPIIDVVAAPDGKVFATALETDFAEFAIANHLFQQTMKRDAHPAELEKYVAMLENRKTPQDVRKEIQKTELEFRFIAGVILEESYIKLFGESMHAKIGINDSIVKNTKKTTANWIDKMMGGDLIEEIEAEWMKTTASKEYYIKQLYNQYLNRDPQSQGVIDNWANQFAFHDREGVKKLFLAEDEVKPFATQKIVQYYEDLFDSIPGPGDTSFSNIEAAKNKDGSLELFGIATDGTIHNKKQTGPNGPWSDWEWIHKGPAKEIAVVQNKDNSWTVFGVDKNTNNLFSFSQIKNNIELVSGVDNGAGVDSNILVSPFIVNGDLEWGNDPGNWRTLEKGSEDIKGWTIESSSVDYDDGYWKECEFCDSRSLDMQGSRADGSISQEIPTIPDSEYQVTFYLAGNPNYEPIKKLDVSAGDSTQTFEFDITVKNSDGSSKSRDNMGWTKETFDFTATGDSTPLIFTSSIGDAASHGAALDNISIVNKDSTENARILSDGNIAGAKWITFNEDANNPGTVTYRTSFDLPQDATNPSITVQAGAIDKAVIYLNGKQIGYQQGTVSETFTHTDTNFNTDSTPNTLDFVVYKQSSGPVPPKINYRSIVFYDTSTAIASDWTWNPIADWDNHEGSIRDIEVVKNSDGSIEVYGIDDDKAIKRSVLGSDENRVWELVADGDIIDVEVALQSNGKKILFGVGTNNALFYVEQNDDGVWNPNKSRTDLGGGWKGIEFVTNNDGSLELYGLGNTNGNTYRQYQNSDGEWIEEHIAKVIVSDIAVDTQSDGKKVIFGVDGNNHLRHVTQVEIDGKLQWDPNQDWADHEGWVKDIQILPNKDGLLEVIGVSNSNPNYVSHVWQMPNGNWTQVIPDYGVEQHYDTFKEGIDEKQQIQKIRQESLDGLTLVGKRIIQELYEYHLEREPSADEINGLLNQNLRQDRLEDKIKNFNEAKHIAKTKIDTISNYVQDRDATDGEEDRVLKLLKQSDSYDYLYNVVYEKIDSELRTTEDANSHATDIITKLYKDNLGIVDKELIDEKKKDFQNGESFEQIKHDITDSEQAKNFHKYYIVEFNKDLVLNNKTTILEEKSHANSEHKPIITRITVDPKNMPHTPYFIDNKTIYKLVDGKRKLVDIQKINSCDGGTSPVKSNHIPLDIDFLKTGTAYVLTDNEQLHKLVFDSAGKPDCIDRTVDLGDFGNPNLNPEIFEVDIDKNTLFVVKPGKIDSDKLINTSPSQIIKLSPEFQLLDILEPKAGGSFDHYLTKGDFFNIVDIAFSSNEAMVAEGTPLHRVHYFDTNPFKQHLSPVTATTVYLADKTGEDSFSYTVNDSFVNSNKTTVTLKVQEDIEPPVITNYINMTQYMLEQTNSQMSDQNKSDLEKQIRLHSKHFKDNPMSSIDYEKIYTVQQLTPLLANFSASYEASLTNDDSKEQQHVDLMNDIVETTSKLILDNEINQCLPPLTLEAHRHFDTTMSQIEIGNFGDGRMVQFAIGTDDNLYHKWQLAPNDKKWSEWLPLGESIKEVEVFQNDDKRIELFAVKTDGTIVQKSQVKPNGDWADWVTLSEAGFASEIEVGSQQDGKVHLFAVEDPSHHLFQKSQKSANGDEWTEWKNQQNNDWIRNIVLVKLEDRLHLWGIGSNDAIYQKNQLQVNSEFTNWKRISWGNFSHDIAAGVNVNDQLEVFSVGSDNRLWHNTWTRDNGWYGWQHLSGVISDVITSTNKAGLFHTFVIGGEESLYQKWEEGLRKWSTPFRNEVPETGGGFAFKVKDMALGQNQDGRLELFVIDSDNKIQHKWQRTADSDTWTRWFTDTSSAFREIEVVKNEDGLLEMVALGNDGAVYHKWVNESGHFSKWVNQGGFSKDIHVIQNQYGKLHMFSIGGNNEVFHKWQIVGQEWSDWASLGGWAKKIQVAKNNDGRLEVFTIGKDSKVFHKWETKVAQQTSKATGGQWVEDWKDEGGRASDISITRNSDGNLSLFAIDDEKSVQRLLQDQYSTTWNWNKAMKPEIKEVEVSQTHEGKIQIFGIGTDNRLWGALQEQINGDEWPENWTPYETNLKNISVIQKPDGQLMVFGIGSIHPSIHYKTMNSDGTWNTMKNIPGKYEDIAVEINGAGKIGLFAIDSKGVIKYKHTNDDKEFSEWIESDAIADTFSSVSLDDYPNFVGNVPFNTNAEIQDHLNRAILLDDFDHSPDLRVNKIKNTVNGQVTKTLPLDPKSRLPIGVNYVEVVAADFVGNKKICDWQITIQDTTAPEFVQIGPFVQNATGEPTSESIALFKINKENLLPPKVFDEIDDNVVLTNNIASQGYAVGEHDLQWTATDFSGNSKTGIQKIIIEDDDPPLIDYVKPITVEATNGYATNVPYEIPQATDVGGISVPTRCDQAPSEATFPIGNSSAIRCWAQDNAGHMGHQVIGVNVTASDDDDDGIINLIDYGENLEFSDESLNGTTSGKITKTIQNIIHVIDGSLKWRGITVSMPNNSVGFDDDQDDKIDEDEKDGIDNDGDGKKDEDTSFNLGDDYSVVSVCDTNDIELVLGAIDMVTVSCLDKILFESVNGESLIMYESDNENHGFIIHTGEIISFDPTTNQLQNISNVKENNVIPHDGHHEFANELLDEVYLGQITFWNHTKILEAYPNVNATNVPNDSIVNFEPVQKIYTNSDRECIKEYFGIKKNACPTVAHTIVITSGSENIDGIDPNVSVSPIIVNGDFETGPRPSTYKTLYTGNSIKEWTVDSGSIDYVLNWQDANGNVSLDMQGSHADGVISQFIDTIQGKEYEVTFYLAGNPNYEKIKKLDVSAGDSTRTFEFDITGKSSSNMGWTKETFDFTATSDITTLIFASSIGDAASHGAALDNISILEKDSQNFAHIVSEGNIAGAKWITNDLGGSEPGTVTYRATFELPQRFSHPLLSVKAGADDSVAIYLNGEKVGFQNWLGPGTFTDKDSSHFKRGINHLDFVVYNKGTGINSAHVNFEATITVVPFDGDAPKSKFSIGGQTFQ